MREGIVMAKRLALFDQPLANVSRLAIKTDADEKHFWPLVAPR
jgi:hypothetical protein